MSPKVPVPTAVVYNHLTRYRATGLNDATPILVRLAAGCSLSECYHQTRVNVCGRRLILVLIVRPGCSIFYPAWSSALVSFAFRSSTPMLPIGRGHLLVAR